jgi:hypothetical protein
MGTFKNVLESEGGQLSYRRGGEGVDALLYLEPVH